jgi:hypothetical protein
MKLAVALPVIDAALDGDPVPIRGFAQAALSGRS